MRKLPIYLLLDTSGSMHGEPIEAVKNGVDMLVSTLLSDPYALETAYLSVITFDSAAQPSPSAPSRGMYGPGWRASPAGSAHRHRGDHHHGRTKRRLAPVGVHHDRR